ncbi:uncharacterized protein LOC120351385 [Nilaparvata lugens]|uniref:uncharacterized protein LOC120351385 n=1 Tax=Nilaparvata lugens TaxID=108931 RepID=UPI00193E9DFE|nr:uncharacterized protein LOC120351385 [Nilaparvata lugens]
MVEMIDLMISLRNICGVKPENKFLFAVPGTPNSYYRCSDVIREMRNRAGTKYPERVTTTSMRKEAATLAAACGLTREQVEELASFLGHSVATHKQHYRLPQETIQKARVAKFLLNIQQKSSTAVEDQMTDGMINDEVPEGWINDADREEMSEMDTNPPPKKRVKVEKKPLGN